MTPFDPETWKIWQSLLFFWNSKSSKFRYINDCNRIWSFTLKIGPKLFLKVFGFLWFKSSQGQLSNFGATWRHIIDKHQKWNQTESFRLKHHRISMKYRCFQTFNTVNNCIIQSIIVLSESLDKNPGYQKSGSTHTMRRQIHVNTW